MFFQEVRHKHADCEKYSGTFIVKNVPMEWWKNIIDACYQDYGAWNATRDIMFHAMHMCSYRYTTSYTGRNQGRFWETLRDATALQKSAVHPVEKLTVS